MEARKPALEVRAGRLRAAPLGAYPRPQRQEDRMDHAHGEREGERDTHRNRGGRPADPLSWLSFQRALEVKEPRCLLTNCTASACCWLRISGLRRFRRST